MSEFFHMGGYAAFVWSAYGISALALIVAGVWTWRAMARAQKRLAQAEARSPRRRRRS